MPTKKRVKKPTEEVPNHLDGRVKLSFVKNLPALYVCTYKSGINLHTPDDIFWLTAADAEKLGDLLLACAARRREIDAAEKAWALYEKSTR
jgi:hypothetical protein